jgi:chloride channel protein, CIC family
MWRDEGAASLLNLSGAAALIGVATGVMAATFKILLHEASTLRTLLLEWARGNEFLGLVVAVVVCSGLIALAASLVHRVEPHAEGSGIPCGEAVVEGRVAPGRRRILPVKYVGGLLAMGSGLALGREGPSVQMGGSIAVTTCRLLRITHRDLRVLVAAGAAAGLATAFNAPIAGGVFVLEELVRRFDQRTTLATLVASGMGFTGAQLLLTNEPEFVTTVIADPTLVQIPMVLAVGAVTGLLGITYSRAVLLGLRLADLSTWPVEARAAVIGASVGVIGWLSPGMVGGGDNLTQQALLGQGTLIGACGILLVRFVLGAVSYAAGTPGGLFAPMLVLGSQAGLVVGLIGLQIAPATAPEPAALALIGMASFFTAAVRAPVTGIVLATELTGSTAVLAPMLGACAVAMLLANVLKSEPIYDALAARSARAVRSNEEEAGAPPQ